MTTIGVIGAMDVEIKKLISIYKLQKDHESKEIYVGNVNNKKIVVAMSGVGKTNSSAMTQYIIDNYKTDAIINSGIAGAISSKLNVMDIVISDYVTYHDFTESLMESYVPDRGKIKANATLISIAKKVVVDMKLDNAVLGNICSGDIFVQDKELRNKILLQTGSCCVDMESASIAHTCSLNNIPFIAIRTISDTADGGEYYEDIAAYKSSEFVVRMVHELFLFLTKKESREDSVYLYVPNYNELDYYEELLKDAKTMKYNAGYDINLDGYDKSTGCVIKFDKKKWYKKLILDKNRYFAYVINKKTNKPIGYVNFHFDDIKLKHSCGVIIEYNERNKGYGSVALSKLLKVAFKDYKLESLISTISYNKNDYLKILVKNGFKDSKNDFYIKRFDNNEKVITMEITKDMYNNKVQ